MGREGPPRLLYLPPGFRFNPTDEELVVEYLRKKSAAQSFVVPMIAEVDIYRFDPWNLPEKALFGDKMCYFFSHRDRKYPNGSRPNRAAGSGYWKATGTDKPIYSHAGSHKQLVGVKKSLVFFIGKTPKGTKTNWIMHEYRLADAASRAAKRKGNLRLDGWVLCGIYKKPMGAQKAAAAAARKECNETSSCNLHEVLAFLPDIDNTKLLSLPPLSSLNIFKEQNCCKYMEVTDFADNVCRSCAGMPWRNIDNTNKNSVPSLMALGQKADQQYSNRGAGVLTEVAPYKCKYSCPIDGLHEYNSPTRNGNINNDLAAALPMPESPPLMNHHDSPDEEIQGTFRLHDEMDQLHPSQQLAFEYNNQVQTTFNASHMDPMNMVFEPVCLESLQSSHPV